MNRDYRLYILMRNDLESMTPGRACAQASHAANVFVHDFGPNSNCYRSEFDYWSRQTKQGFGTAIVLGVNIDEINYIFKKSTLKRWIMKGLVWDPDYGVKTSWELFNLLDKKSYHRFESTDTPTSQGVRFFRKVVTCAYVFGEKDDLAIELGKFPLY